MLQKISQYNAFIVMSSFHANNIIVVPEVFKKPYFLIFIWSLLYISYLSGVKSNPDNLFCFLLHFLVSENPYCGSDCHGNQPGEAGAGQVEDLKHLSEEADQKHDQVEEAEGDEPGGEGDRFL